MSDGPSGPPASPHRLSRRQVLKFGASAAAFAPLASRTNEILRAAPRLLASAKPITGTYTWATVTPTSMSPFKALAGNAPFIGLAYDPLLYISGSGVIKPALATKWGFSGPGNTTFNVTLRDGVKFADGTPLTADAVKAHFDAFKLGAVTRSRLASLGSTVVTGPMTIQFQLSTANPAWTRSISDVDTPGHVISPTGLATIPKLDTTTAGTGPYMLDPSQSVIGDHYVFVQNPYYWDTTRKRFDKVVVRNIIDPAAVLSAMQTGEVDLGAGTLSTASAAQSAGLTILTAVGEWIGVGLIDRGGVLVPALGSLEVRQALNYAVNRTAITKGIYGKYGIPTDGIATPGLGGYTTPTVAMYPYNLKKAKQLMSKGGYPDGFSMNLLASSQLDPNNDLITAMADEWSKIGVHCNIFDSVTNWATDYPTKKWGAVIDVNGNGLIAQANAQLLSTGTSFNPFGSSDDEIVSLFTQAVNGTPTQTAQAEVKMATRVRQLAWYVPVALVQGITLARPGSPKFSVGAQDGYPQIAEVSPAH